MKQQVIQIISVLVFMLLMLFWINHSESVFYERMTQDSIDLLNSLELPDDNSKNLIANFDMLKANISSHISNIANGLVFGIGMLLIVIVSVGRSKRGDTRSS